MKQKTFVLQSKRIKNDKKTFFWLKLTGAEENKIISVQKERDSIFRFSVDGELNFSAKASNLAK